jgi:trimethyllysine dioxygenase
MISDLVRSAAGVSFRLDGKPTQLSWTWLRDHARDESSYLASANQRLVTPATIAAAGDGEASIDTDCNELIVRWPDGAAATYSTEWLVSLVGQVETVTIGSPPVAWSGGDLANRLVTLDFERLTTSDHELRRAVDHLWADGVITITDVPTDTAATRRVLERFGYIRTTIFGELWEFSSDGGFDDTASTPLEITPHTDGTYSHDAPGMLGLHCYTYEATGGENVFVDSQALAARLAPDALDVLRSTDIPGQYIGDGAHLMACRPALRYVGGRLVQVSYNHHDRAPFVLPEPDMSQLYAALFEFDALANDPTIQFELAMRPGDMVLFDNWRVLHGRRAFVGERHIAGGYINREDIESTTRRLHSP